MLFEVVASYAFYRISQRLMEAWARVGDGAPDHLLVDGCNVTHDLQRGGTCQNFPLEESINDAPQLSWFDRDIRRFLREASDLGLEPMDPPGAGPVEAPVCTGDEGVERPPSGTVGSGDVRGGRSAIGVEASVQTDAGPNGGLGEARGVQASDDGRRGRRCGPEPNSPSGGGGDGPGGGGGNKPPSPPIVNPSTYDDGGSDINYEDGIDPRTLPIAVDADGTVVLGCNWRNGAKIVRRAVGKDRRARFLAYYTRWLRVELPNLSRSRTEADRRVAENMLRDEWKRRGVRYADMAEWLQVVVSNAMIPNVHDIQAERNLRSLYAHEQVDQLGTQRTWLDWWLGRNPASIVRRT